MDLARAGANALLMDTDFNSSPEPDFGSSSLSLTHTNSGSTSQQGSGSTAESMAAAKRRKIRKGTRSCWECKRRKIRCVFDSASPAPDAICIGCQRRGTTCVSQEFPEETSQTGGAFGAGNGIGGAGRARQMGDRIVRVEALVEQLVKKVGSANAAAMIGNAGAAQARKHGPPGRETTAGSSASADRSGSTAGIMTPDDSSSESAGLFSVIERSGDGLEQEGVVASDGTTPARTTPPDANNYLGLLASAPSAGKYAAISKALHALLPSQTDALAICSFNGGSAVYLKQLMTRPYNYLTGGGFDSLQVVALIPPPTVHPVLLAKKLLQFAVCLQYVSEEEYKTLEMYKLGIDHREAMGRMADAAIQLVTSNDELIGSIDGLECVLTECVFHSDAGNLRRAWLTIRRAMVIAQLMGLHKGAGNHQPLKVIDPLRQRIFPSHIWFRIVFADRFMSLMLGLPQGSLDRSMVDEEALAGDTPLGRLERHGSIVASRILERNESGASLVDSLHETQQIDLELQRIAKLMPAKWWLMPNLVAVQYDWEAVFHATIQMMDQMYYYAMLIHLHLPYMLRFPVNSATTGSSLSSAGTSQAPTPLSAQSPQQQKLEKQFEGISHSRSEYSKMTCVNAARELLARFISFRSVNTIAFCCRAVDFFALTAAMTLLLAHLDSHKASAAATPGLDEGTDLQLNYSSSILAHSRLGDRAMLEQTLENMQKVAATSQDVVSRKSEEVLRRLLAIEAEAAEGTSGFTTALATENLGTAQQIDLSLVDGNDPDADGEMEDCMTFEPNRKPGAGGDQSGCGVDDATTGTPGQLRMCIPYFGTIKIAREGTISKEPPSAVTSGTRDYVDVEPQLPNDTIHLGNPGQEQLTRYPTFNSSFPPETQLQAQMGDRTSPKSLADYLNNARRPSQHRSGTFLAEDMPNLQPSQADFNLAFAQQQAAAFANNLGGSMSTGSGTGSSPADASGEQQQFGTNLVAQTVRQNLTYPGLTASTDDWAFQGAELAFFDTLMKGAPGYDGMQGGQGTDGALW